MYSIMMLIIFVFYVVLIIGLIKPEFFKNRKTGKVYTRKQFAIALGVVCVISFILFGAFGPKVEQPADKESTPIAEVKKEIKEEKENLVPLTIGEPEKQLKFYIEAIMRGDWETVYNHTQLTWRSHGSQGDLIKNLRMQYQGIKIKSYKIVEKRKDSEAFKSYRVQFVVNLNGKDVLYEMKPNLICETGAYQPDKNGDWGINPLSAMIMPAE